MTTYTGGLAGWMSYPHNALKKFSIVPVYPGRIIFLPNMPGRVSRGGGTSSSLIFLVGDSTPSPTTTEVLALTPARAFIVKSEILPESVF